MKFALAEPTSAAELATALGLTLEGVDCAVSHVAQLDHLAAGCLGYSTSHCTSTVEGSVLITAGSMPEGGAVLRSENPRLDFIRALQWLKLRGQLCTQFAGQVHPDAAIDATAIIDAGCTISAGCRVGPFSRIHQWVYLGKNAHVGTGCVVGHDGFGFEREAQGRGVRFPHLGSVVIGENVEIGQLCVIARGSLENTHIDEGVKIDDQSYIAHNVTIGRESFLMSGSRLNGRVRVGERCWIGTAALIREGIQIGDGATIGMGSVVTKNVPAHATAFGNPARIRA